MAAKIDPNSRAGQVRKAENLLKRLLKTPKTRNGLVAAVADKAITKNFVYGWLATQVSSGAVIRLKSASSITFQLKGIVIVETPCFKGFPTWLDPRTVPVVRDRKVFIDGALSSHTAKQEREK
jgi:hypothetical protein